jgi:hypothetical protein
MRLEKTYRYHLVCVCGRSGILEWQHVLPDWILLSIFYCQMCYTHNLKGCILEEWCLLGCYTVYFFAACVGC